MTTAYRPSSYSRLDARRATRNTKPSRKRRRKASAVPSLIAAAVVLVVIVFGAVLAVPRIGAFLAGSTAASVPAGQPVDVTIPDGSSGAKIAKILLDKHVIDDVAAFSNEVKRQQVDTELKPGEYHFKTGQNPRSVVSTLAAGPNVHSAKLTIQEGLTVRQTAQRVEQAYGISQESFLAQAKASNYVADYPFLTGAYDNSLEGYLYPKTYSFTGAPTADLIIRTLLDQFKTETAGLELAKGANGLNSQQIVTVASLIERETAAVEERPMVASVIYNRLAKPMKLKIDAAIVYARGGGNQAVSSADLAIDSPYNLYKHDGLPPGPICSPSASSIKAAISPAKTTYLYYVLSKKGATTHRFTDDDSEFARFVREYQESRS